MARRGRTKRGASAPKGDKTRPGTEQIDLDLSIIPTVEDGLADAAQRDKAFTELAMSAFGDGDDLALFEAHLPFHSFINRAVSLHRGIVDAVRASNPHVAFTLLRAYLELVVLVFYVDSNPGYIEALKRPMAELPPNTRKRFSELFGFAGKEMTGVITTYGVLNEMAHFGSTALWHPFVPGDEGERRISFSTAPGWRKPDDARAVLAMLLESDEAIAEVLQRYRDHHLLPRVERYKARRRIVDALAAARAHDVDEDLGEFSLPHDLAAAGIRDGIFVFCDEHSVPEIAEGVTPDLVDEWLATLSG